MRSLAAVVMAEEEGVEGVAAAVWWRLRGRFPLVDYAKVKIDVNLSMARTSYSSLTLLVKKNLFLRFQHPQRIFRGLLHIFRRIGASLFEVLEEGRLVVTQFGKLQDATGPHERTRIHNAAPEHYPLDRVA